MARMARKQRDDQRFFTRDDEERAKGDPLKLALMHAVLGEYSVPGLLPFGENDDLLREYDAHPWDSGAYVVYDSIARDWLVICEDCGFVARTSHGSTSIDAGIGSAEDAADMQEECDPDMPLRDEVAVALAQIEATLRVPHIIMTQDEQQKVYGLLGYDAEEIPGPA